MDKFEKTLPMMLHRTLDSVMPLYRKVFKQHKISEQQWRILRALSDTNGCTSADLAAITLLPKPSMVGIVDRMESKGLLIRERSREDRRKVYIRLTQQGLIMQAKLIPQIDEVYSKMINHCDPTQWATMIDTLQVIIDSNKTAA